MQITYRAGNENYRCQKYLEHTKQQNMKQTSKTATCAVPPLCFRGADRELVTRYLDVSHDPPTY